MDSILQVVVLGKTLSEWNIFLAKGICRGCGWFNPVNIVKWVLAAKVWVPGAKDWYSLEDLLWKFAFLYINCHNSFLFRETNCNSIIWTHNHTWQLEKNIFEYTIIPSSLQDSVSIHSGLMENIVLLHDSAKKHTTRITQGNSLELC